MKKSIEHPISHLSFLKYKNAKQAKHLLLVLFLIIVGQFFCLNNAFAQTWTQLGPGAGGQERALLLDELNGEFRLYVGSDVSGVWMSNAQTNLINFEDPSNLSFSYISNHRIMRFANKFYKSDDVPGKIFTCSRGGIDIMNTGGNPLMKRINDINNIDLSQSWVSDLYIYDDQNTNGTLQTYFVTGNTRVSDDAPDNVKDWPNVDDFYVAKFDPSSEVWTSMNGYSFDWNNYTNVDDHNVYCMLVNHQADNNVTTDEIVVGTEMGLFYFENNPAGLASISTMLPVDLQSVGIQRPYKVTSISRYYDGTDDRYLITIHGHGVISCKTDFTLWQNEFNYFSADHKTLPNVNLNQPEDLLFTQVLPIFNTITTTQIDGWLLMNENNDVAGDDNLYGGIFYCATKNNTNQTPDGDWVALNVWGTNNDWGWNSTNKAAAKPCNNINSSLLTPENKLMSGKNGNIFITKSVLPETNIVWQQMYTKSQTTCTSEIEYSDLGYVNTATVNIFPVNGNEVWLCDRDRPLNYSSDKGEYVSRITKNTNCFKYEDPIFSNPCGTIPSPTSYGFTDCLFMTTDANNTIFAGMGEGYSVQKGRGCVFAFSDANNTWIPIGKPFCGDPKKLLFAGNDMYLIINADNGNILHKFNTSNSTWEPLLGTVFENNPVKDAAISPNGTYLHAIVGSKYGRFEISNLQTYTLDNNDKVNGFTSAKYKNLVITPAANNEYTVWLGCSSDNYFSTDGNLFVWQSTNANLLAFQQVKYNTNLLVADETAIDNIEQIDEGVTALVANSEKNLIYVAYLRQPLITDPPEVRIMRCDFTASVTNVAASNIATPALPTKSVIYMNARTSTSCNDVLYICSRGLGTWRYESINTAPLAISLTSVPVQCDPAASGTITVNITSGASPFAYIWSNSQSTATASNLSNGTYTVTVTDAGGCTASMSATLLGPVVVINANNVLCNGGTTGVVSANTYGGTPPYSYLWSNGSTNTTQTITGLPAGTYTVTVTDAFLCSKTASYTVTEPSLLTTSCTGSNVSCTGSSNGSANVTASGGTIPYSYNWSNGVTTSSNNNLITGTYTVTVTDGNGCTITCGYEVTEPTPSFNNIIGPCIGGNTGVVTAVMNGGAPPYTFSWSNSQSNATATGLTAGTYTVTITDANNCTITGTVVITEDVTCCGIGTDFINSQTDFDNIGNTFNKNYNLNTDIVLNADVTFDGATFYIAEGRSITVPSGITLTITNNSLLKACGNMWQGIIVEDGGTLEVISSTIQDAQYGARVVSNGNVTCESAVFDRNFVGLKLENNQTGSVSISGSTFNCTDCLNGTPLAKGYPGQSPTPNVISWAGIEATNATFNIGVNGGDVNVFQNIYRGLSLNDCFNTVLNSTFNNIQTGAYYLPHGGYGIYADMANGGLLRQIGIGEYNPTPTFNNCANAIFTQGGNLYARNNNMTNMYKAIRFDKADYGIIEIRDNVIQAHYNGITGVGNDYAANVTLQYNTIDADINFGHCIYISESNARTTANIFNIRCNTLNGIDGARGIKLNAVDYALLTENNVTINSTINNSVGIHMDGSNYCTLLQNSVIGNDDSRHTAYLTNMCTDGNFTKNYSHNTFIGFDFWNECYNTDENFKGNTMGTHEIGLHLNGSGIMGIQTHRGNKWNGPFANFGAVNENSVLLEVQNNPFKIHAPVPGTQYHPTNSVPNVIATWFKVEPGIPYNEFFPNACDAYIMNDDEGNEYRLTYTDTIIVDDSIAATEFEGELKYFTGRSLLNKLEQSDSLRNDNGEFEAYYNAKYGTAMHELNTIRNFFELDNVLKNQILNGLNDIIAKLDTIALLDSMVLAGNTNAAAVLLQQKIELQQHILNAVDNYYNASIAINNSHSLANTTNINVEPTNDIETYEQQMHSLRLLNYNIAPALWSQSDIGTLTTIAQLCPFAFGRAVFRARTQLNFLGLTNNYDDKENCAALGYYRKIEIMQQSNHKENVIKLFPNPANNMVRVYSDSAISSVSVLDNSGKIIYSKSCPRKVFKEFIEFDISQLCNGLYTVAVHHSNDNISYLKLAVTK